MSIILRECRTGRYGCCIGPTLNLGWPLSCLVHVNIRKNNNATNIMRVYINFCLNAHLICYCQSQLLQKLKYLTSGLACCWTQYLLSISTQNTCTRLVQIASRDVNKWAYALLPTRATVYRATLKSSQLFCWYDFCLNFLFWLWSITKQIVTGGIDHY